MTFFTETRPRARSEHRCGLCDRTIRAGEVYRRGAGMDGATAWTWIECAHCDQLARWVCRVYDLDDYDESSIIDWDPESVDELRLKANYRRKWTRRDGSLVPVPTHEYHVDKYGFGRVCGIAS